MKECVISAKELYGRWMDELWAGKPVANDLVSEDFVGHWPDHEVHGPDELNATVDKTRSMLTDLQFVIDVEPFVEGDMLAARWIGTGATPDGLLARLRSGKARIDVELPADAACRAPPFWRSPKAP